MPEQIFEQSVYKIRATLKEGAGLMAKKYTGKVDLIYKSGATVLGEDTDLDVTKGTVTKDYKVVSIILCKRFFPFVSG